MRWSKFVDMQQGVIIFHDVNVEYFGVKDFFSQLVTSLPNGLVAYKLFFVHSAGLGIITFSKQLYDEILLHFENVYTEDMINILTSPPIMIWGKL